MPSISIDNPPASVRGMRHLRLDMNGRLLEFGAIPLEIDGSTEPARPMDWKLLFTSAGLDRSAFEPTTPSWIPPVESDERAAWSGVVPGQPDQPLRLEAAAHRGRLVAFRRSSASPSEPPQRVSTPFLTVLLESLILVSLVLAWFNARSGRVDRRGAIRLGVPFFLLALAKWVVGGHYALTWESLVQFRHAASQALFLAVTTVIIYLAVEPHVRRRWPTVLVAWSRVLAGRWRDPLVGRHVLVGMAMSSVAGLLFLAGSFWGMRNIVADSYTVLTNVLSARTTLAELISIPLAGIAPALFTTIYMLVLRTVTPGDLAAVTLAAVVAGASYFAQGGMITVPIGAALAVLSATCLIRFGLVALMAYFLTSSMLAVLTAAFVLNSGAAAVTLLAIAGLALGAAYVAMGSPKLPRTTGTAATL
jgi:hypothetical protein